MNTVEGITDAVRAHAGEGMVKHDDFQNVMQARNVIVDYVDKLNLAIAESAAPHTGPEVGTLICQIAGLCVKAIANLELVIELPGPDGMDSAVGGA